VRRAIAFLDDAVTTHGEPPVDGQVLIPYSQAALAVAADRSAGTVAWYLRQAGDVVRCIDGGLVIDVEALDRARARIDGERRPRSADVARALMEHWGPDDADRDELVPLADEDGRPPRVRDMAAALGLSPSTTQRHLEILEHQGRLHRRGGQMLVSIRPRSAVEDTVAPTGTASSTTLLAAGLADVAVRLSALASELLATTASEHGRELMELPRVVPAQLADRPAVVPGVAGRGSLPFGSNPERQELPDFLKTREGTEHTRGSHLMDDNERADVVRCDRAGIERALEPLHTLCRRTNLPHALDETGRQWLSRYTEDELRRGAAEVVRRVTQGHTLRGKAIGFPLGLLVSKAKTGDDDFFAGPPPPPVATVEKADPGTDDPEAAAAVSAMGPAELEVLDDEIRASVRSPRLLRAAEANPNLWEAYRRSAWRAGQAKEA